MIYLYSLLTMVAFWIGLKLSQKLRSTILNPFLIALAFLITILLFFKISYHDYYQGNFPLNNFLGVSVVALALPFYEQLPQIRKKWREILFILVFSTFVTLLTGIGFALLFGADQAILAAVLPKSVSMPMAVIINNEINGNVAIMAVGVMIAGLVGAIFGFLLLRFARVRNIRAIGLSMGAASHALGTGRCLEYSLKAGSYSSIALVACGVLSSILAPFIFKMVITLFY
ncbi:CidB/LrgB family autolysis modulator [Mannheimia granulomatis]|uniref:LrgB family protein n=1 Tax=Mannheimia granulomatis TaxID=85402 RepID=UPI00159E1065|nr:LrgB family protein [Mannheimia granulomatis]QLB14827.1 CidB/LrgB family autolysis modulator [Mannheimia granulomatis]